MSENSARVSHLSPFGGGGRSAAQRTQLQKLQLHDTSAAGARKPDAPDTERKSVTDLVVRGGCGIVDDHLRRMPANHIGCLPDRGWPTLRR